MKRENVHPNNGKHTSRKLLALVLALLFMVSVLPSGLISDVYADNDPEDSTASLEAVEGIEIVLDGEVLTRGGNPRTVTLEPGTVSVNVKKLDLDFLPESAEFVKARLVDDSNSEIAEVKYLATYQGNVYYSISDSSDTGTLLGEDQSIQLVYGTKYWVTINPDSDPDDQGTYLPSAHFDSEANKYYVWKDEDLTIRQIKPNKNQDYTARSITYRSGSSRGTVDIEDSAATIEAGDIRDDITVTINFEQVSSYSINDVSYEKNLGNGGITGTIGKDTLTSEEYQSYFRSRWLPESVATGGSTTFYLYSSSNTGGSEFLLNMLRINGVEIEISGINKTGEVVRVPSEDADAIDGLGQITVEKVRENTGLYWLDNKPNATLEFRHDRDATWTKNGSTYTATGWNKKRTIYRVTIQNVHSDIDVEYNFKQKDNREIIIKGREGILETAHARQEGGLLRFKYYFESAISNVYSAYYTRFPSANLYLYRVKPGYNPYTVEYDIYYVDDNGNSRKVDGNALSKQPHEEEIYDEDGEPTGETVTVYDSVVGLPEEVISKARAGSTNEYFNFTTFDSWFRYWGGHTQQTVRIKHDTDYGEGSDFIGLGSDYMLTSIGKNNSPVWYAVALAQDDTKNQQLYINAKPYKFYLQLNLGKDGTLDDNAYTSVTEGEDTDSETNIATANEEQFNTVLDPLAFLPEKEPTRDGYIFDGWVLQRKLADGTYVNVKDTNNNDVVYQSADQIDVSSDLILNTIGKAEIPNDDQYIRLAARWDNADDVHEGDKTRVNIKIYTQVADGTTGDNISIKGGKTYELSYEKTETQVIGNVVLLNQHAPEKADYYTMREGTYEEGENSLKYTKLTTYPTGFVSESNLPESNQLRIYYDYKLVDLRVKKVVQGKTAQKEFKFTVNLNADPDSPVSNPQIIPSDGVTASGLTFTKTVAKNEVISLEDIPYGYTYNVSEAGPEPQYAGDFETTYSPSPNGSLTEDTTIEVINKGKNPGIETNKVLSPEVYTDGTYTITLDAYATGESYVEDMAKGVPTDFVIVVDQSGSMAGEDVGYRYIPHKQGWTVGAAADGNHFYKDDGQYYLVKSDTGTVPVEYSQRQRLNNTLLNSATSWSLAWWCRTNGGNFYVYDSETNDYYYLFFMESGIESVGSYHVKFFYVRDKSVTTRTSAETQYNNGNYVPVTVNGSYEVAYSRSAFSLGLGSVNSNNLYLDVPVYTYQNGQYLYYDQQVDEDTTRKVTLGNVVTSGNAFTGTLYTAEPISRLDALKNAVTSFVSTVAENAANTDSDHRVALVGFAGNQVPAVSSGTGWQTGTGSNRQWDYVNTGLFLNNSFKHYKTITGYSKVNSNQIYNNKVYYIKDGSTYYPVKYDPTGVNDFDFHGTLHWYRLDNNAYIVDPSHLYDTKDFYTPVYQDLTAAEYQAALVSASAASGSATVNPKLTSAINSFQAWGGTYTSFGMAMANNVLENATDKTYTDLDGNELPRKKVIIVFTDGVPGGTGYDEKVAGEALADSYYSKNDQDATVYTVYMTGENTTSEEKTQAESFLNKLSSNSDITATNVYDDPSNRLDPNVTYYYTDPGLNKSYAVTTTRPTTGASSLTYWEISNGGYYAADNTSEYNWSYYNAINSDNSGRGQVTNPQRGQYYYAVRSYYSWGTKKYEAKRVLYDYQWYDTDGRIVEPMRSASDSASNHYQFFTYNTAGNGNTEYHKRADSADELNTIFDSLTSQMNVDVTAVTLNGENSFFRDVITKDFELPMVTTIIEEEDNAGQIISAIDYSKIKVYAVPGQVSGDDITWGTPEILWSMDEEGNVTGDDIYAPGITENSDGTKFVDVRNFNYGENYISTGHPGKKLQVVIDGLTIGEDKTGLVNSNTADSAIYKIEEDGTESIVETFPMPRDIDVPSYNAFFRLVYTGTNAIEGLDFPVTFKLTNADGTKPFSGTYGNYRFNSDGEYSTTMTMPDASNPDYRMFTDLPRHSKLTVTVDDPDGTKIYYEYEVEGFDNVDEDNPLELIENEDGSKSVTVDVNADTVAGGESQDDPDAETTRELQIKITDTRTSVTVTNETRGDYADLSKAFPLDFIIKDAEGHNANGSFIDTNGRAVIVKDGKIVTSEDSSETRYIELKDGASWGMYLPKGYSVTTQDANGTASPYNTTFEKPDETDQSIVFDGGVAEVDTSSGSNKAFTIIHTLIDPVVTGVTDSVETSSNLVWYLALAMGLLAGVYILIAVRRKRRNAGS